VILTYFVNTKGLTKFVLQNVIISKSTLFGSVLDKHIIKREIVSYLPLAKKGFQVTVPLEVIVNSVLYKLKNRCSMASASCDNLLTLQSVYYHYHKCSRT
jgi:hypothetical protein